MGKTIVHWLGAGLSSVPGIQAVAKSGVDLVVWNRTLEKAKVAIQGFESAKVEARPYTQDALTTVLSAGDIVVSMLPATMHPEIAKLCLEKRAHLVTTSYISPAMKELHDAAVAKGLCFVNEAGLDPGIDHLFARELMREYRASKAYHSKATLFFRSLCGGFPEEAGEFRYKFSWSPLGVLRALRNKARYIKSGVTKIADQPWKDLFSFEWQGEKFEAYPNRDSIPYLEEYGFDPTGRNVGEFIRGTLRLSGWAKAWEKIFDRVENGTDAELEKLSNDLWTKYRYEEGERDRVVLYVGLRAEVEGQEVWSGVLGLNEYGVGAHTAMARTVSLPASFAVSAIQGGRSPLGVSGAPMDDAETQRWFQALTQHDVLIRKSTH